MRAIGAALAARGVAPERIATEVFGAVAIHSSGIVTPATAHLTFRMVHRAPARS